MERQLAWKWSGQSFVLSGGRESAFYYYGKRLMDLVLATLLLVFCFPLMLLIAILIKLDTPGPVFFVQERVGARRRSEGGRTTWKVENFCVHKFRSMVADADQSVHQAHIKAFVEGSIQTTDMDKSKFKLKDDPRVTRIGRILRKTSLDEVPQLFNVIKGEMSLVGPRPVPTYEVAEYQARHHERLAALPGITGLWQVKGRSQVSFEEMIAMDIDYVRSRSLWLDIKVLFLTVPAVLSGRGAD
jgi:lipopolysaccharide/colanic/teichoic acid biosynthesis glycosyltransferase